MVLSLEGAELFEEQTLREVVYSAPNIPMLFGEFNQMQSSDWELVLDACRNDHVVFAFMAMWAKFLCSTKAKDVFHIVHETHEARSSGNFPASIERMSERVRDLAFQNLSVLQVTYGCLGNCSFCDVAAPLPVVDGAVYLDHMPFNQVYNVFEEVSLSPSYCGGSIEMDGSGLKGIYDSSDPMSHPDILCIATAYKERYGHGLLIKTNLPPDSIEDLIYLLEEDLLYPGSSISVTSQNYRRVIPLLLEHYDRLSRFIDFPKRRLSYFVEEMPPGSFSDFNIYIPALDDGSGYKNAPKVAGLGVNMSADCEGGGALSATCVNGVIVSTVGAFNCISGIEPSACYPTGSVIVPIGEIVPLDDKNQYIGFPVEKLLESTFVVSSSSSRVACKPDLGIFDMIRRDRPMYLSFDHYCVDALGRKFRFQCNRVGMQWIVTNIDEE